MQIAHDNLNELIEVAGPNNGPTADEEIEVPCARLTHARQQQTQGGTHTGTSTPPKGAQFLPLDELLTA